MPEEPEEWPQRKEFLVKQYRDFVDFLDMKDYHLKQFPNTNEITEFGIHDNQMMELIHADIVRTSHHIPFFPNPKRDVEDQNDILASYSEHMRRLERILYVFGKMNRTISYSQGFNELICPIFYVFLSAIDYFDRSFDEVEIFSFFVFQNLLSATNLQEIYTTQDGSSIVRNRMRAFKSLLVRHFPEESKTLDGFEIDPLFYAFPWLSLLFSQLYLMPDLVLAWDALFAHFDNLIDYASCIAVATVHLLEIDPDDYLVTMTRLRKSEPKSIRQILKLARDIWDDEQTVKEPMGIKEMIFGLLKHF